MDHTEEQELEAEALKAIFDTSFEIIRKSPHHWKITLYAVSQSESESEFEANPNGNENENHVGCRLIVDLPKDYPESPPHLDVELIKGLALEHKKPLLKIAHDAAKQYLGMPAIFSVCEAIKEWLVNNNDKNLPGNKVPVASKEEETQVEDDDDITTSSNTNNNNKNNNNDDDDDKDDQNDEKFVDLSEAIQKSLSVSNTEKREKLKSQAQSTSGTILDPIYIPTPSGNETWALTWPIWHMLPHSERKQIAIDNGFRTIGEFEEEVILSRALREDNDNSNDKATNALEPYENENLYELEKRPQRYGLPIVAERSPPVNSSSINKALDNDSKMPAKEVHVGEDNNDDGISVHSLGDEDAQLLDRDEDAHKQDDERDVEEGGLILLLPDELILHDIFSYLSTDTYATCALVSTHWRGFTRSELAYKDICKRAYLNQSKRKTLHVARFGGSYRTMLEKRWRVKAGCGVYVLKCTKIRKIQRDMWTEIPHGVILESTYYRYLNFYEDGRVLYALTSKPPHEMIPIFLKIKATRKMQPGTVFGKFEIQKDNVVVDIEHPWHHVKLFLQVLKDGCIGARGRFWALSFEKHQSSASNNFDEYWSTDLVTHDVPEEPFRFLRDWRL